MYILIFRYFKDFLRESFVYVVLKVRRASLYCLVESLGVEVIKDK